MTDTAPGKLYGALHAWRDGDVWRYLPATPSPQRNADGRAQLTAIDVSDMLMLTLGASLTATEEQLAQARAAIAAETGSTEQVRLQPAAATIRGAQLMLILDGKDPVELARANPSPLAPYSAAFSAMLRGDVAKQANAAMKTATGRIEMAYDVDVPLTRAVTARITGDPGDAKDAEAALAAGDLTLQVEADAGATDALKQDARRRVVDEVTRHLERMATAAPSATGIDAAAAAPGCDTADAADPTTTTTAASVIDAQVTRTEPDMRTLRLSANLAHWL